MKTINIEAIETKYEILADGRIINRNTNREQKGTMTNSGYKRMTFFGDRISLHRVIATKYLPIEDDKEYVNHLNGDKLDNRVENLEWCTASENAKHAFNLGLRIATDGSPKYGEDNAMSILTDKMVIEILTYKDLSYQEIADKYNVSKSTIKHIFRGRTWKHIKREVVDKKNTRIKMSLDIARTIRERAKNGERQIDMSKEFKVAPNVISKIISNITWKENDIIQKGQI